VTEAVVEAQAHHVPLRTIALLAGAAFASSVNIRAIDPLLPQIADAFGSTVGRAAQIVTFFTIGYGLTQLLFGPIGDRLGKYLVVALTTMAAGAATLGCAFAISLDMLTLARFGAGAFAAAAIPLAFAWIGDAVPFEGRQPVLARFLTAQMTGIILGQAAGGILGDLFGWRAVFMILSAVHVLAGLAMLAELKLNPGAQPPSAPASLGFASVLTSMVRILARPWSRILLFAVFAEALALYGAFAYVGAHLRHRFGISYTMIGAVMALYGFGAIAYSLSARRLLDRLGEKGLVVGGGALMATAFAGLAFASRIEVVPPLMMLLGLAFYMMHNTLQTSATQMAPEARGLGVSLFAFALFMGQSIGVAAAAPVMDRYGAEPIFLAGAAALIPIALWFRARLSCRP
jgi:MFS transporter, YNFM family, putative membrane transport protein